MLAVVCRVPMALLASVPHSQALCDMQHHLLGSAPAQYWRLAACKQQYTAPRSCARSLYSGQPLYLRFPGKQFHFITEKSPALRGEGGAWPQLHTKGPILVLIFLISVELTQPLVTLNHRKVFLFGFFSRLFLLGGAKAGSWGTFVCWFCPPGFLFLWCCCFLGFF